jgi:formylglycine-generating enzyme required for sulfatase activity
MARVMVVKKDLIETLHYVMLLKEGAKKLLVSSDRLLKDDDDLARVLAGVCAGGSSAAAADNELVGWVESQRTVAKQAASEAKAAEEKALAEMKAKAEATKARIVSGGAFQAGEQLVVGLALRWIPAGRFTMGSPGSEEVDQMGINRGEKTLK